MPAPPELAEVAGEIGEAEVGAEADAEQARRADGDVRIPAEVPVDLQGKGEHAQHHRRPGPSGVPEGRVGIEPCGVRDDHLLEHPPTDEAPPRPDLHSGQVAGPLDLWEQARGPHDGAGDQLGEEGHVGRKGDRIPGRRQAAAVHVDAVAQRLERVEADAHRQDDGHPERVHGHPDGGPGGHPLVHQKAGVFEPRQHAEVEAERQAQPSLSRTRCGGHGEPAAHREVDGGRGGDQREEARVPPPVEEVAGHQQERVLRTESSLQQPVEHQHGGQEQPEGRADELHGGQRCPSATD